VGDDDWFGVIRFLYHAFDDMYEQLAQTDRDLVLADFKFIGFLALHVHAEMVQARCRDEGIAVATGPLSEPHYHSDWETVARDHQRLLEQDRSQLPLRRLLKNLRYNSHLGVGSRLKGILSPDSFGLGSYSMLKRGYVTRQKLYLDHHYWQTLFGHLNGSTGAAISLRAKSQLRSFLGLLEGFCREKYSFTIDAARIEKCWESRLQALSACYAMILDRRDLPDRYLYTESGNPLIRVVAHAIRRKGGRAVDFLHGHNTGGLVQRSVAYSDIGSATEFVSPTRACAAAYRRTYEETGLSSANKVLFTSIETSHYESLCRENRRQPFPRKIESVMLMGFPMNAYRYVENPGYFFYFQLDLELRLTRLLRENGFRVLYKIHPDRKNEVVDLFASTCDDIVSAPFESAWREADAILTKYTASTAFFFALCTNRPIFVLDVEKDCWRPDHYELLKRRCRFIPAWINARNRIDFDDGLLIKELSRGTEDPDFSYVYEFLVPKKEERRISAADEGPADGWEG
jgi:hypothetical protein